MHVSSILVVLSLIGDDEYLEEWTRLKNPFLNWISERELHKSGESEKNELRVTNPPFKQRSKLTATNNKSYG